MNEGMLNQDVVMFSVEDSYRIGGRQGGSLFSGQNPLPGAVICFYLEDDPGKDDIIQVDFLEKDGALIRSYNTNTEGLETGPHTPYSKMEVKQGMNIFSWDLSYPGALRVPGMILWGGYLGGPTAVPGEYMVRLRLNDNTIEKEFSVLPDPRSSTSLSDLQEQFDFIVDVRDKLSEIHRAIIDIRKLRDDISDVETKLDRTTHQEILEMSGKIKGELVAIEEALYQTKNRSRQDPLNYPIKLGNKLAALNGVVASGDWKPTDQAYDVRKMLVSDIDRQLERLKDIISKGIPELNSVLHDNNIEYVKY
jgi:hypothetical protein